jgi:hypothetical protein
LSCEVKEPAADCRFFAAPGTTKRAATLATLPLAVLACLLLTDEPGPLAVSSILAAAALAT